MDGLRAKLDERFQHIFRKLRAQLSREWNYVDVRVVPHAFAENACCYQLELTSPYEDEERPLLRLLVGVQDLGEDGLDAFLGYRYAMDPSLAIEPFALHKRFMEQASFILPEWSRSLADDSYQFVHTRANRLVNIEFGDIDHFMICFFYDAIEAPIRPSPKATLPTRSW